MLQGITTTPLGGPEVIHSTSRVLVAAPVRHIGETAPVCDWANNS
ncbi:hypothetical protein [Streptomyces sp. NPDC021622]